MKILISLRRWYGCHYQVSVFILVGLLLATLFVSFRSFWLALPGLAISAAAMIIFRGVLPVKPAKKKKEKNIIKLMN